MRNTICIALLAAVLAVPAARAEEEVKNDQEYGIEAEDQAGTVDEDVTVESTEENVEGSGDKSGSVAEDATVTPTEEPIDEAGTEAPDTMATTRYEEPEVSRGLLKDEKFGIKPQFGAIAFTDPVTGEDASRGAVGLLFDWNIANWFTEKSPVFFGPQFGGIFSHLGSPGSNFFGSDAPSEFQAGANILTLPANLKVAANIGDRFRIGAHGGANFVYRSIASSMNLGREGDALSGDNWSVFPNVGADVEFGLGRNVSLMFRPDMTFTPADDFFTGTVSLGIPLG